MTINYTNNQKMLIKKATQTPWHLNVKRPASLLDASIILESDLYDLEEIAGIKYSQGWVIIENGLGTYYHPKHEVDKHVQQLGHNLDETKLILQSFHLHKNDTFRAVQNFYSLIKRRKPKPEEMQKFLKYYKRFIAFRIVTRVLGYHTNLPSDFINQVASLRLEFKNNWTELRVRLDKIWVVLARHHGLPPHYLTHLTDRELLVGPDKKNSYTITAESRIGHPKLVLYKNRRSHFVVVGEETHKFVEQTLGKTTIVKTNVLSGQVACSGHVRGTVLVVENPTKAEIPQHHFILVTSMTTPNYVPLLKYADGIITDEGGLTCHAAIIARELNIPCVIGTKIATQILKSGDVVELDARQGKIRLLKSGEY